jgi:thiol-disulfide isomerase/thioredoxin
MENKTFGKVLIIVIIFSFIITPVYALEKVQAGNSVSILKIDNINVNIYQNENYKLPKELKAMYSDKRIRTVNVVWDVKAIDVSGIETSTYYGKVSGYNNIVKLTVRIMAPDFELKNTEGKIVKLSDYKGKIVILNFWTTWCKYCYQIMPELNELNNEFKVNNNAEILSINEMEDYEVVKDYISQNNVNCNVLLDKDGKAANLIGGINGYPTTIIINKDGTYNKTIIGAINKEALIDFIDKMK